MKHYQMKISLEQFKSRMPSIVKAYYDNGKFYTFNGKGQIDQYGNRIPYTNYGLIPFFIKLTNGTIWKNSVFYQRIISYNTLTNWYHFLEFYIKLLSSASCSPLPYNTATEYYTFNENNHYSFDECQEFDQQIINICGYSDNLYNVANVAYNYLTKYYFPYFLINDSLRNAWKTNKLSIQEANYWVGWFKERKDKYIDINKCSSSDDCCDCQKYFDLGGITMYNNLLTFLQNIPFNSLDEYVEPYFSIKIPLISHINNLGEFTALYEQWEGGVDYSQSNKTGTVVEYNNLDWSLIDGKGYFFNDEFKEFYFGNSDGMNINERQLFNESNISDKNQQYERLIEKHAKNNDGIQFNSLLNIYKYFVFDVNNKKIFLKNSINQTHDKTVITKIFPSYIINFNINNFFLVKGKIYQSQKIHYITLNNQYYVINNKDLNQSFVIINNIIYYSKYDELSDKYYFNINNNKFYIQENEGIIINEIPYFIQNNQLIIGGVEYKKFYAYSIVENMIIYFNDAMNVVSPFVQENQIIDFQEDNSIIGNKLDINLITSTSNGYFVDNDKLYIITPFTEYECNKITGYTESKLSSFIAATDIIYDNLGNKLPGVFLSNDSLKDGSLIGLQYKPKTVIHLSQNLDENGHQIITSDGYKEFWGDFLDKIELYYIDNNNNLLTSKYELTDYKKLEQGLEILNNELNGKNGILKCDFTYFMGCTLQIANLNEETKEKGLFIKVVSNGIKYIDTTSLSLDSCKFFFNDTSYITLKYYQVTHELINYYNDTYHYYSAVNKAKFSYDVTNFFANNDMFVCNGWTDFPHMKEEYQIGIASMNNVEADIYINRGTARAFDSHLKLLEVNSLESLEQYGNGTFNIITN